MENKKNDLIDPLLEKANVYKLKCEKCKSVSIQITQNPKPETYCIDCGGTCKVL